MIFKISRASSHAVYPTEKNAIRNRPVKKATVVGTEGMYYFEFEAKSVGDIVDLCKETGEDILITSNLDGDIITICDDGGI